MITFLIEDGISKREAYKDFFARPPKVWFYVKFAKVRERTAKKLPLISLK